MKLKGQKIIVTGGSRGIGAGIVKRLAQEGATIAFSYAQQEAQAQSVLKELQGPDHFIFQMNLSSEESIQKSFDLILDRWKQIDGLVNNAGITKDQLILRTKVEDFDKVLSTNLRGTFLTTKAVLKPMLKAQKGSIVNITSVIGQIGNPGQASYAASKAGIEAMSKCIAQELGSRNIRINCVAPGYISTEMTEQLSEEQKNKLLPRIPSQSIGIPQDVAASVAFLLSDEARYITGHTLNVNGGLYMN